MAEMTTGIYTFCGHPFDIELALEICDGKRPEFALETPSCYIELAKLCMDSDLQKRPTAETIPLKKYSDIIYRYASKFINTHDISQKYKERNNQHDIYGSIPVNSAEIPVDETISDKYIRNIGRKALAEALYKNNTCHNKLDSEIGSALDVALH
ncbi:hypothetical protein C2G38_2217724 [Gigaspora rosea]|uniref:Serine-threonine/tyrosine-protein kinase catalytic domain-containing protein n=1 Tax=Gigaspora rosea TaxID=44941 RepID=A0A397U7I0_9GLOM|nr:hypothetical protein C2G38_2217724 [Gigaspora rosea]